MYLDWEGIGDTVLSDFLQRPSSLDVYLLTNMKYKTMGRGHE